MTLESKVIHGFIVIALLTVALVVTEVHTVVLQFLRDKDRAKLFVYVGTIALLGGLILNTTYGVFGQVLDAAQSMNSANGVSESGPGSEEYLGRAMVREARNLPLHRRFWPRRRAARAEPKPAPVESGQSDPSSSEENSAE